jgi:hypothetical protein
LPRYKDIRGKMGTLYGFKHPSQYDKESLFKPASKANTKHILASLALKVTRHSVMIAKLSSYPRSRITNGRRRDQASEPGKLEACKPLRGLQLTGYRDGVDLQELVNLSRT